MDVQTEAREERRIARGDGNRREDGAGGAVVLGPRDSLVGKLTVEGDLEVHGTLEGEVQASGDIQVDASAKIKAQLEGRNVRVRGHIDGNVTAKDRLQLTGSGRINGDVKVKRLSVEDGATLNGNVSMRHDGEHKGG